MFPKEKDNQNIWIVYLLVTLCSFQLGCSNLFYKEVSVIDYQVRPGDSLSVIANGFNVSTEELVASNGISNPDSIQPGQILEIPYNGQGASSVNDSVRTQLRGTKFSKKPLSRAEVRQVEQLRRSFYWPVSKEISRISSKFGWRWTKFHDGLDIAAKTGSPIYAAHSGQVLASGYQLHGYGRMVIIQSEDILTVYAHNSKNYVHPGQMVSKGEEIAAIGMTGKATGPHLHFEVRIRNREGKFVAVDPIEFLS